MTVTSAADLAAVVREQLAHLGPFRGSAGEQALDALLARCEEAEEDYRVLAVTRERGCACGDDEACAFLRRAEAAEAERDEARQETVILIESNAALRRSAIGNRDGRLEAQARVAELEAALREIADLDHVTNWCKHKQIARAALQSGGAKETPFSRINSACAKLAHDICPGTAYAGHKLGVPVHLPCQCGCHSDDPNEGIASPYPEGL